MKKETKHRLMAIAILLLMGLSPIAYVFFGGGQQTAPIKPLTGFVVDGEIDPQLENTYVKNGFTFLKLYYNESLDFATLTFFEQAPSIFTTSTGQTQLIVQKIEGARNYARMLNLNTDMEIDNLTQDELYTQLCTNLMALPTECAVIGLNLTL